LVADRGRPAVVVVAVVVAFAAALALPSRDTGRAPGTAGGAPVAARLGRAGDGLGALGLEALAGRLRK
jgi:hypothetical protein